MTTVAVWHGTTDDLYALQRAIAHNCNCGHHLPTCLAHQMLTDQKTLDHLAFVLQHVASYLQAEFD